MTLGIGREHANIACLNTSQDRRKFDISSDPYRKFANFYLKNLEVLIVDKYPPKKAKISPNTRQRDLRQVPGPPRRKQPQMRP